MGLEKAIEHGKEKREPYRGGKSVSFHCRNHGGARHSKRNNWECMYCRDNRLHKFKIDELKGKD